MRSAWEAALGDAVDDLQPRIREYVRAIPGGLVGRGSGEFTEAGCQSRLLRAALSVAARWGIAFPEHGVGIPFTIENRADADGAIRAIRTLHFPGRERVMVDRVREHRGLAIDALGSGGRLEAALQVSAHDGALVAASDAVRVRLVGRWWTIPRIVRPHVALVERWDHDAQRQHVDVRVTMPGLGLVYGYHGCFDYRVEKEFPPTHGRLGE